jgi:hypothetical protein
MRIGVLTSAGRDIIDPVHVTTAGRLELLPIWLNLRGAPALAPSSYQFKVVR